MKKARKAERVECTVAREVKTKASKTFTTTFCPVGGDALEIVIDWCNHLRTALLWGEDGTGEGRSVTVVEPLDGVMDRPNQR